MSFATTSTNMRRKQNLKAIEMKANKTLNRFAFNEKLSQIFQIQTALKSNKKFRLMRECIFIIDNVAMGG